MSGPYVKDPYDKEDYGIDYSDWVAAGDAISASSWDSSPSGLTLSDDSVDTGTSIATVVVTGGTHGVDYLLTNSIVTDNGLKKQRSIVVLVRDQ